MSFGEAKDEIKTSDNIWGSSAVTALREQQETDFGWWSGAKEFKMSDTSPEGNAANPVGEWENHTTNKATIRGNELIKLLSSSFLQLYIDVDEDTRKKRKKLSSTEQLANGIIWQADRDAMLVPSGKPVQASLATMAVLRGGVAQSLYWYTDEKIKKPRCVVQIYDPMFCQWLEADGEIIWFCYRDYITKYYIDRTYKKQKADGFDFGNLGTATDKVLRYTFWNDEEYRVACNGEWLDKGVKHGLDRVPINIRSCGAIPYLSSVEYTETMQYSWQSYAVNTRRVYPLESKLLSIEASIAAESAKRIAIGGYDSLKSNNQPPDLTPVNYGDTRRNKFFFLDVAKGQEFFGFADAPNNGVTDAFYNRVEARMDIAVGLDQGTLEMLARSGNTSLASEIRNAAEEERAIFRKCVEDSFIWLAEEGVRQFIERGYEKVVVEGRDRKRERFYAEGISVKDVEESHFDCHLVAGRMRDEVVETEAAIREVQTGLSSRKTAMVKHNLHQDPDKEIDKIQEELAELDPVFRYDKLALHFHGLGTPEGERYALYFEALAKIEIEKMISQAAMGSQATPGGNGQGQPQIEVPGAERPVLERQLPPR